MPVVDDLILRMRTVGARAAGAEVEGVASATGKLREAAKFAAGVAGIGALAFGLEDITKTAIDFQQQEEQLHGALRNMGQDSEENMHRLTEAADALATHGGFDPAQNISGLTRLITAHDSVGQAIKDETLVTDIARRAHMSYQTALRAVMNVEQGRTTGLARLGIVIKPVTTAMDALIKSHQKLTPEMRKQAKEQDAQASKVAAMHELWKRFGGAVQDYSHGAAGAVSNFRNTIDVLFQHLGQQALPFITAFVRELTKLLLDIPKVIQWVKQNANTIEHLGVAAGSVAASIGLFALALNAAAIAAGIASAAETAMLVGLYAIEAAPVVAAVLAVAAVIYLLVTHFKQVKAAVGDAIGFMVHEFNSVRHFVGGVVDWMGAHWKILMIIMTGGVGILVSIVVTHFSAIRHFVGGVLSSIGGFFSGLAGDLKGPAQAIWNVVTWPFREELRIVKSILGVMRGVFGGVLGFLRGLMNPLWSILTWPFREAIKFVHALLGAVKSVLGPLGKVAGFAGHVGGSVLHFVTGGAGGGPANTSGFYDVGEQGRERIFLPRGSYIQRSMDVAAAGAGGGVPLENHVTFAIGSKEFARAVVYSQTKDKATR